MAPRLNASERARIEVMTSAGVNASEVAEALGRDRATVYRELKRGSGPNGYEAAWAQAAADRRAARPKTLKFVANPGLASSVTRLLEQRLSPHTVSAQLRIEGQRVCAETIYQACYDHSGASGLRPGCWRLLPRRRRRRKHRNFHSKAPGPLGDFKSISQRPAAARDRSEPGHWEGDLLIGEHNLSAILTLIDRYSRQTLLAALPHGYNADSVAAAIIATLARQPRHLLKTLTWDRGREMARWRDIEQALDIDIYFCDPRSPWQRPTIEQTNGLLRRWLPKGTDLNIGTPRLAVIEDHINTMPRRLHNWNSAHLVHTALASTTDSNSTDDSPRRP